MTYPCWDLSSSMLVKAATGVQAYKYTIVVFEYKIIF